MYSNSSFHPIVPEKENLNRAKTVSATLANLKNRESPEESPNLLGSVANLPPADEMPHSQQSAAAQDWQTLKYTRLRARPPKLGKSLSL